MENGLQLKGEEGRKFLDNFLRLKCRNKQKS